MMRKAPLVAAVDRDDGRPGAFRPDEDVAVGLALVVQRRRGRAAEDHVGGVGQRRIAVHARCRASRAPGCARRRSRRDSARAICSRAPVSAFSTVAVTRSASCVNDHEPRAVAQRDGFLRGRERAQDRIEHVLRAALAPLRALRRRRRLADAGKALAPELVAGEARDIDIVLRVVARVGRALDRRRRAPSAGRTPWCGRRPCPCAAGRSSRRDCSISTQSMPRQPRSPASASPTGPPPTMRTGTMSFCTCCDPMRCDHMQRPVEKVKHASRSISRAPHSRHGRACPGHPRLSAPFTKRLMFQSARRRPGPNPLALLFCGNLVELLN